MSALQNYFLASYLSTQASTYFNRVLLVSNLAENPDPKVVELREAYFQSLRNAGQQYVANIVQANSIYDEFNLPELDLPRLPEDYFHWVEAFRKHLRASVEENSKEQFLVDYAYHMASICTDLAIFVWSMYLHLHAKQGPDMLPNLKQFVEGSQRSKLIWAGTAVLLGRQEGLLFLWQEWQSIDHLLNQFYAFGILENSEKQQEALYFADALLPKFHETVDRIVSGLDTHN